MKGHFIFGRPRRRLAMTFGYEYRPSLWRTIRTNSHLVIAGLGTASFLGVAALGLWLAMPSEERSAFADAAQNPAVDQAIPETPVVAKPEPSDARGDEVTPQTAAAEADIPVIKPNDIRWKDPNAAEAPSPPAPEQAAAQAVEAEAKSEPAKPNAQDESSSIAAFAAANRAQVGDSHAPSSATPDTAETAAIPTAKPDVEAQAPSPEPPKAAKATGGGHTVRAVTMRSNPRKGAPVVDTIPAKATVQVVSCSQWCEVIFKSKRGFIYKSYLKRD